MMSYL